MQVTHTFGVTAAHGLLRAMFMPKGADVARADGDYSASTDEDEDDSGLHGSA